MHEKAKRQHKDKINTNYEQVWLLCMSEPEMDQDYS